MARLKHFPFIVLLGAAPFTLSGCAPPMLLASAGFQALSSGTAVYINGELEGAYRVPIADVWAATQAAFEDMQFEVTSAEWKSDVKALLFADELSGRSTTVIVTSSTAVVTQITVRVGFVGDQSMSRLIMDRIEAKMSEREALPPIKPVPVVPVSEAEAAAISRDAERNADQPAPADAPPPQQPQ